MTKPTKETNHHTLFDLESMSIQLEAALAKLTEQSDAIKAQVERCFDLLYSNREELN